MERILIDFELILMPFRALGGVNMVCPFNSLHTVKLAPGGQIHIRSASLDSDQLDFKIPSEFIQMYAKQGSWLA